MEIKHVGEGRKGPVVQGRLSLVELDFADFQMNGYDSVKYWRLFARLNDQAASNRMVSK